MVKNEKKIEGYCKTCETRKKDLNEWGICKACTTKIKW